MSEGVSVKQVIVEIIIIIKLIKKNWLKLIFLSILGGALFFSGGKVLLKKKYESTTSLSLADSNGGAFSSYMALATQLGLSDVDKNTEGKLIALLKSERNFTSALLSEMDNGEKLINYYIEIKKIRESWAQIPRIKSFKFTSSSYDNLSYLEDSILETVILKQVFKNVSTEHDKESNLIILKVESTDEAFAYHFSKQLINSVIKYFTVQASQKEKSTYEVLKWSLDSVVTQLRIKEEELAKVKDKGHSIVRREGNIKEMRLMRDVKILGLMYSEGLKNLELAKISFLEKKPIVDIIDKPILPLKEYKKSGIVVFLVGAFLFGGITLLVILFRYYFNFKEISKHENLH